MWSSNIPEADWYLRNFFPEAIEDQVIPQTFEQRRLMRQTNLDTGQNEKEKFFEEGKEKHFYILHETEQKRFSLYTSYSMVSCWADDEIFHSHGRQSLKKCSRTVKTMHIHSSWSCLHLYSTSVWKNTQGIFSYYDFGLHT